MILNLYSHYLMFRLIPFVLIALLLLSCAKENSNTTFELSSFGKKTALFGEKVIFSEILMPEDILIKNNRIVISDRSNNNLLHVIDKESLIYLSPKGFKGVGPNEQLIVKKLDHGIINDRFYAYDGQLKKFFDYSLEDTLRLSTGGVRQNEGWSQAVNLSWTRSGDLVSNTIGEDRYVIYDTTGIPLHKFGKWRTLMPEEEDAYIISDLYQGNFSGNISNNIYVLASSLIDHFEILNINSGSILVIEGPVNNGLEFTTKGTGENSVGIISNNQILGYNGVYVGDKSIFLVYIGKSMADYADDPYASKDIFQFDLSGNPIAHYNLDIPIKTIAVDESSKTIYAVSDDEDPGLVVFKY